MSSHREISTDETGSFASLPDEVICQILSLLPTKKVIAASILSKRLRRLRNYIPALNFGNIKVKTLADNNRFNEFVHTLLFSRERAGSHSIDRFWLDIEYDYPYIAYHKSFPNVINWINYVVKQNVQFLNLTFSVVYDPGHTGPNLPISVFSCRTLVVLKLRWFSVEEDSCFNFVGFPSLKALHLNDIYFDKYEDFLLLLGGCPVLEDLKVSDVYSFRTDPLDFDSSSLSKLNRAYITGCRCDYWVKALSNLEYMRIQLWKGYHPTNFPIFHNLTHLVLNYNWDVVVEVLNHCPKLQNLDLYQNIRSDLDEDDYITEDDQDNWDEPTFVPQCLSSYLRTCTIRDFAFAGLRRHLMLAGYILKNAKVLETMIIWCNRERPGIESILSSCAKASATCQLSIY